MEQFIVQLLTVAPYNLGPVDATTVALAVEQLPVKDVATVNAVVATKINDAQLATRATAAILGLYLQQALAPAPPARLTAGDSNKRDKAYHKAPLYTTLDGNGQIEVRSVSHGEDVYRNRFDKARTFIAWSIAIGCLLLGLYIAYYHLKKPAVTTTLPAIVKVVKVPAPPLQVELIAGAGTKIEMKYNE